MPKLKHCAATTLAVAFSCLVSPTANAWFGNDLVGAATSPIQTARNIIQVPVNIAKDRAGTVVAVGSGAAKSGVQLFHSLSDIPRTVAGVASNPENIVQWLQDPIQTAHELIQTSAAKNYLGVVTATDPQFIQIVMGIKQAKAIGIIHSNTDCQKAASIAMVAVFADTGDPEQATVTKEVGDMACDDAVPPNAANVAANSPGGIIKAPAAGPVQLPLGVPQPPMLKSAGFNGLVFENRPVVKCEGPQFPGLPGSPILVYVIYSNLALFTAVPAPVGPPQWVYTRQWYLDYTGQFVAVAPVAGAAFDGIGRDGWVYRVTPTMAGTMFAAPIGQCQSV